MNRQPTKQQIKRHEEEMSKYYGEEVKYSVAKRGIVVKRKPPPPKPPKPKPAPKKKIIKKPAYWCKPGVNVYNPHKDIPVDRIVVYAMYDGHCAYCGNEITYKEMEVDHIIPKSAIGEDNRLVNLHPSCKVCNHFKRDKSLADFRAALMKLHETIRKYYVVNVAMKYGIVTFKPFDGRFYYEE